MKLGQLLETIQTLRGAQYDTFVMVGWVNEIEAKAIEEVANHAEGVDIEYKPYSYDKDTDGPELVIPDRFADVYVNYMLAKIDYMNQETERYNNDVNMYESAWREYQAWHIRTHKQKDLPRFKHY